MIKSYIHWGTAENQQMAFTTRPKFLIKACAHYQHQMAVWWILNDFFFVVAHWEMQLQSKRFLKPKCSESIAKAVGVVWLVSLWTYCFHWDRPVHREAGKFGRFCFGVCWQAFRVGLFSVSHSRQSWLVFSLPSSTASSETDGICSLPFTFVHTFCSFFFQPIWYYRFSMGKFSSTITFS